MSSVRVQERNPIMIGNAGQPPFPYGETKAGNPYDGAPHVGHDVANLTARHGGKEAVGRRVCLDCDVILGPLVVCNRPTKNGRPCRVPVRTDLGHTTCWSHGEGAGRTSTRRRRTHDRADVARVPDRDRLARVVLPLPTMAGGLT